MNKKNIPNYITIFRFTLVPIICYLITMKTFIFAIIATWLFLLACISDFLDGYLARKLNSESEFGRCFDNIADKVLNICIICVLLFFHKIWLLPSLLVIAREVLISSFREYAALNCNKRINVDIFGKAKTTFQFIALLILIIPKHNYLNFYYLNLLGNIIFSVSASLSIISAFLYLFKHFRYSYER